MPVNIKGKDYTQVHERILEFRNNQTYTGWSIIPKIKEHKFEEYILIQARIYDDLHRIRASGLAYEKANSTFINKTSYVENCETSAIGRALATLGIGIQSAFASSDEVNNAIIQQKTIKERDDRISKCMKNEDYLFVVKEINKCVNIDELKQIYKEYETNNMFLEGDLKYICNQRKKQIKSTNDVRKI